MKKHSGMEPVGTIPGPYGKAIQVFKLNDEPDPDRAFVQDIEGSMDLAGIHDPRQRAACRLAFNSHPPENGIPFRIFLDNGGRTVPKKTLVRPEHPATVLLPADAKIREVADNWVTLVMDQRDWAERAEALLDVIGSSLDQARSWSQAAFMGDFVHSFALSILITSAIEHLAEDEIDCLEQAAFYSLTTHEKWQRAGTEWLKPFRKTWFRDWAKARPTWQEFARDMRKVDRDLPIWLVKGTSP